MKKRSPRKYARRKPKRKYKIYRPKAKLGSGVRYRTLAEEIKKAASRRGYKIGSLSGLVASLGRKKFGKKKFAALSKRARKRRSRR